MADTFQADESLPYLRALGDPDRLKIVQILRSGPQSVGEISRKLDSPIANVSHHLGMLKDVGIVTATKRGRFVIHELSHNIESKLAGTHTLDFGCCRIEFGEHKSSTPPADMEQALQIINRLLAGAGAVSQDKLSRAEDPAKPQSGQDIEIVNGSFELPATPFFDPEVTGWQKEGDPAGTGVFRNFPDDTPLPGSRFVQNADGQQLATIGARGGLGLFQTLDAVYVAGTTYTLTALVGVSSLQPPAEIAGIAPALRLSLMFNEADDKRREVVGRSIAPDMLEGSGCQLTRVSVKVCIAKSAPCASKTISICISSADNSAHHTGHFILDQIILRADAQMPV